MMTPWDDSPLELYDPEENFHYFCKKLIGGLYQPKLLNSDLKRGLPLKTCQVEGAIIAHGYTSIPSKYHDNTWITVQLLLDDERGTKLPFDFRVRVDRSVMHEQERRRREHPVFDPGNRPGLFGPAREEPGNQKSVSREGTIPRVDAGGKHDATRDARTPKTN